MSDYRCFICDRPGTVNLMWMVFACDQHMGEPEAPA